MSSSSKGGSKTRNQSGSKLKDFVGPGKELNASDAPTLRSIIQKGILIKELAMIQDEKGKKRIFVKDLIRQVAPLVLSLWQKSNAKFCPPVTITEKALVVKLERLWGRVEEVAQGRKEQDRENVEELLEKVLDITVCPHTIFLCSDEGSGCEDQGNCAVGAHIKCDCPREKKVPVIDLQWLAVQRRKRGEKSKLMMAGGDKIETEKQNKSAKRKAEIAEAERKRKRKEEEAKEQLLVDQSNAEAFLAEVEDSGDLGNCEEYVPPSSVLKEQEEETRELVKYLLEDRLGSKASLVVRFLDWPGPKRNTMPVSHTAKASLRWENTGCFFNFNFLNAPYHFTGLTFSGVEYPLHLPL